MSRSSRRPAGPASLLVNVPAPITLHRGYLAQLRGDAEGTAAFASQALAELGEDEWMLSSIAQGFLAVAEWLRGRLAEAERAFASSIAGWRAAGQRRLAAWALLSARPGPARPGPPGRGRRGPTSRRWRSPRRPAGRLPAAGPAYVGLAEVAYQRDELDSCPAARHRGHRAVPAVRLHPAAGHGPGDAGLDPAGRGRSGRGAGGDGRGRAGRAGPGRGRPAQPRPGAAGAAAAGPGRRRRGRPLDAGERGLGTRTTSRATRGSRSTWCWRGCCSPRTGPPRRSRCWTGCTRRRSPRAGPAASSRSARCGRWRWRPAARTPRGGRPGRGAHPGLPAGLRPGLRRRGPADGRAAGPAGRGPAGRAGPLPAASRSATWPGCCARSAARTPRRAPGGAAAAVPAWSSR